MYQSANPHIKPEEFVDYILERVKEGTTLLYDSKKETRLATSGNEDLEATLQKYEPLLVQVKEIIKNDCEYFKDFFVEYFSFFSL